MIEYLADKLLNAAAFRSLIFIFPACLFSYVAWKLLSKKIEPLLISALILCSLPLATPFFTDVEGYEEFTAMNHSLQTSELIVSAMLLITIFFCSIIVGTWVPIKPTLDPGRRHIYLYNYQCLFLIAVNTITLLIFLERSSVIFEGYASLKQNTSPYSSLVHQMFNVSFAVLLASIPHIGRRTLVKLATLLFLIISIVMARRNLSVGLLLISIYLYNGHRLNFKSIAIAAVGLILLVVIGEARSVGIISFLQGERTEEAIRQYYSMPGGGANVFLSIMGVIDLLNRDILEGVENYPFLLWASGTTESVIYSQHGYEYNGGMHICSVLYWNFGIAGVAIGGIALGHILVYCEHHLRKLGSTFRGSFETSFAVLVALLLSTLIWYSPIGLLKATIALFIACLLIRSTCRSSKKIS